MRYFLLILLLTGLAAVFIAGPRGRMSRRPPLEIFPDMDRQPKLRPQEPSKFFANGVSSQLPVAGTIARGDPFETSPVNTGKIPGTTNWVEAIPIPVTAELMSRGQERFNIYCTACHGAMGDGKGITTKFGMAVIADLHDKTGRKVVQQPDGQIFNTITHGFNNMGAYGGLLEIEDRWAVIAYVRALQRSRMASLDDVPPGVRTELTKPLPPGPAPGTPGAAAPQPQSAPAGGAPAAPAPPEKSK